MSARGDLVVGLSVQADVAQAIKRLSDVDAALSRLDDAGQSISTDGLQRSTAAAEQLARAVRVAASAQEDLARTSGDSFQALGIRPSATVLADIERQQTAFERLKASGTASSEDVARAQTALAQRVAALNIELGRTPAQLGKISAGQYAQAMRQLPAQITDITTSLASGMPIWLVAIQQGGQIRDSFGGIGPALSAVLGTISPTVVGLGSLAAAAAAVVAGYVSGAAESQRLANALIQTGSYAGTTASELTAMSAALSGSVGTQTQAADALEQMAASGKVVRAEMERIAQAALAMSQVTSQSVEEIVGEFIKLADDPVRASAQLNEQHHYLTQTIYEQIRALDEQGASVEAARLAQDTYAQATIQRAGDVKANLGTLERAWLGVRTAAAQAWSAMSSLGREKSLQEQLDEAKAAGNEDRVWALQIRIEAERKAAAAAAETARVQAAGIEATGKVTAENDAARTSQEKMTKALSDYRQNLEKIRAANPSSALLDPGQIDKTVAAIKERFADKTANSVDSAYQSQLQSLTLSLADARTRVTNAKNGDAAATGSATARLEAWLSVNKDAKNLDEQRIATLRQLATQQDAASKSLSALTEGSKRSRAASSAAAREAKQQAAEAARRDARITAGMADVDARLQSVSGDRAAAAITEVQERWRKLVDDLKAAGDSGGLVKVQRLIDLETAKAQLAELQRRAETVFAEQQRQEQTLDVSVQTGTTGEITARERLLELHRQTADEVAALIPQMEQLAAVTGDPAAAAGVDALRLKVLQMRAETDELGKTFSNTFETSFASALSGLASGTKSVRDVVLGFVNDMTNGIARWAAEGLSQRASAGVLSIFGGGDGALASGAAAVSTAGGAVASAGQSLITGAAAVSTSATQLTAAAAALSAAQGIGSLGSFGSSLGGGLDLSSAVMAGLSFFDEGGYTGPGATHQVAGVVHAGEWVMPSARVNEPGALPFLAAFQARGMSLLRGLRGYATGGLVTPVGGALYQPTVSSGSTTVDNRLQLNLIDDPARIASVIGSPAGEKALTVLLSRNPTKFRQLLGLS